jgi:hypothetical protein
MLNAWSLPTSNNSQTFFDLPTLPADELDSLKRVEWWNSKLKEHTPDSDLKIIAGGRTEYKLNEKPGWLGF